MSTTSDRAGRARLTLAAMSIEDPPEVLRALRERGIVLTIE